MDSGNSMAASSSNHVADNFDSVAMPRDLPGIAASLDIPLSSIQNKYRDPCVPYSMTVNSGEDVYAKLMELSFLAPHIVCVASSRGKISSATIQDPNSSGSTLTFQGTFDIHSFRGSIFPSESAGPGSRRGKLETSFKGADGRILRGVVAGRIIAATPVKVVVRSFFPCPYGLKPGA